MPSGDNGATRSAICKMFASARAAIAFLTILPVGGRAAFDQGDMARAVVFFPLVGTLLGLITVGVDMLLAPFLPSSVRGAVVVTLLAGLTGALHLDGLCDTFDALGSRRPATEMLRIMRDSSIGAVGAVAVVIVLLLKTSCLAALQDDRAHVLVLVPTLSRAALVAAMTLFPYARSAGKADVFFTDSGSGRAVVAGALTIVVAVALCGARGVILTAVTGLFVALWGTVMTKRLGGVTGDILGALAELTETLLFFAVLF